VRSASCPGSRTEPVYALGSDCRNGEQGRMTGKSRLPSAHGTYVGKRTYETPWGRD